MVSEQLKKRIMKKVYLIWFFRKISPALFLYLPFLAVVALKETADEFFVAKIIDNFIASLHGGFMSTMNYLLSALKSAPLLPTLIILFSISAFMTVAYKTIQNLRVLHHMRGSY